MPEDKDVRQATEIIKDLVLQGFKFTNVKITPRNPPVAKEESKSQLMDSRVDSQQPASVRIVPGEATLIQSSQAVIENATSVMPGQQNMSNSVPMVGQRES